MQELTRNKLPDVASANDDRVLEVHQAASYAGSHRNTPGDEKRDGERPKDHGAGRQGTGKTEDRRHCDERPGAGRGQLEDADKVVDRRMIGADVVAVVETEDFCRDDPDGERCNEEHRLNTDRQIRERPGEGEGEHESADVRYEKQPAHQPAAATAPATKPASPQDLERAVVDRVQHTLVEDQVLGEHRVAGGAGHSDRRPRLGVAGSLECSPSPSLVKL